MAGVAEGRSAMTLMVNSRSCFDGLPRTATEADLRAPWNVGGTMTLGVILAALGKE
jgi:hypothetical protein